MVLFAISILYLQFIFHNALYLWFQEMFPDFYPLCFMYIIVNLIFIWLHEPNEVFHFPLARTVVEFCSQLVSVNQLESISKTVKVTSITPWVINFSRLLPKSSQTFDQKYVKLFSVLYKHFHKCPIFWVTELFLNESLHFTFMALQSPLISLQWSSITTSHDFCVFMIKTICMLLIVFWHLQIWLL